MLQFKNFQKLQREISQDEIFRGMQTIVIDIENTLVAQIELKSKEELEGLKELENFQQNYIVINHVKKKECCGSAPDCLCNIIVYKIRPYTFDIMAAMQPFFEIVVFS